MQKLIETGTRDPTPLTNCWCKINIKKFKTSSPITLDTLTV